MKRIFIPLAVLAVLMSIVLIGCGGGGGGGGNPAAVTTPGQAVSLTGKILSNNEPQAGISVYLYRADEAEMAGLAEQFTAKASVRGSLLPDSSTDERTTKTDAAGVYRFDGVPEGEYTLLAQRSATERAAITKLVLSSTMGAVTTQNASLQPTSDISGTISVSGITDLCGGRVYLAGTSFSALTDSAGKFTISYVPTGTNFSLMADFGGAVLPSPVTIQAIAGSTTGSPALPSPLTLVKPSILAAATGNIVGTATCSPFAAGDTDHRGTLVYLMQNGRFVNIAETSPDGSYSFSNVPITPDNVYHIKFISPNYIVPATPLSVTLTQNMTVSAPSVVLTPRQQLAVLGRFIGQVTKQPQYDPAETNSVQLYLATGTTAADKVKYIQISDNSGAFSFIGIPVGNYTIGCADPNYAFQGSTNVLVTASGNTTPAMFTLVPTRPIKRLGSVSGIATKQQKYDPAETDSVQLYLATGTTSADSVKYLQVSAANGAFSFAGIPEGSYTLGCADPNYAVSGASDVQVSTPTITILTPFSLVPTRPITQPIALGRLHGLVQKSQKYDLTETYSIQLRLSTGTVNIDYAEYNIKSDDNGYFNFTNLPIGTYTLESADAGYAFSPPQRIVTVISPANDISANALPLYPTRIIRLMGGVSGTVVKDQKYDPAETNSVQLFLATDSAKYLTVSENIGSFTFTGIPEGSYTLGSADPNYRVSGASGIQVGPQTNVTTTFYHLVPTRLIPTTLGSLRGQVHKSLTYDPTEMDSIQLRLATGSIGTDYAEYNIKSDNNGYFNFTNLPIGTYTLESADSGYAFSPVQRSVTVTSPANDISASPLTLYPTRAIRLMGSVSGTIEKSQKYDPAETNSVQLYLATGTTSADSVKYLMVSDDVGSFSHAGIPVGNYILGSADPNYAVQGPSTIQVSSPTNALSTSFALVPTRPIVQKGGITGHLIRTQFIDAIPASDPVTLKLATGTRGTPGYFEKLGISDANGDFAFTDIPVGTYTLYSTDVGYVFSTVTQAVSVEARTPSYDNGGFTLIPNPTFDGYGSLVGTISTSLPGASIRIRLVSQVSPTYDRETYTSNAGGSLHSFRFRDLTPGGYILHLDQETGQDISPLSLLTITKNTVTEQTFTTVSILPGIATVATAASMVMVNGTNLSASYSIELSHLGQEPWIRLSPTTYSAPSLVGNTTTLGGRYTLRVLVPNSNVLIANYLPEVLFPPRPILSATALPRSNSITVNWLSVPGISQYKAVLHLAGQPQVLQEVNTTTLSAAFNNLEPATSYDIELFTVVDEVLSPPYTLPGVSTPMIQMAPVASSYLGVALMTPLYPDGIVASGGIIYILDALSTTKAIHRINTITMASISVLLPGTVNSASKIFSGNLGLYVTEQENGSQTICIYDPVSLAQGPKYVAPDDTYMMQAAYSPATDRVYCIRTSFSGTAATMTELLPDLSVVANSPLPNFAAMPTLIQCQASRDGSTVGYWYKYYLGTDFGKFHGFLTSSKTVSTPFSYDALLSLQGGASGSIFLFNDNSDNFTLYEHKPALNKQFVINSKMAYPVGTEVLLDGVMNRWVSTGPNITAYDPAGTPLRSFSVSAVPQVTCYDPIARKVFALNQGSGIEVNAFDADF